MQAAIIIPHYNDLARLQTCLAALVPQLMDGVELVVADNASPVDLGPLEAQFPAMRVVTQPIKGAAAARNAGVAATTAPHLIFLDADCVPAPDWLATALALLGTADVIGGRIDTFDETPPPRSGAQAFETVFAFHQRVYVEEKGFSVTANLITTRAIFEDVGEFIVGVSEDLDWCQRATGKGYGLIYADALRVAHPTRTDWPALAKKWRRLTEESFGLWQGPRLAWALRGIAVAGSALVHAPRVLRHPALSGGERLRGLSTLLRLRITRMLWMWGQALKGPGQSPS